MLIRLKLTPYLSRERANENLLHDCCICFFYLVYEVETIFNVIFIVLKSSYQIFIQSSVKFKFNKKKTPTK